MLDRQWCSAVIVIALISACSGSNRSIPESGHILLEDQVIDVAGENRRYHLFLPDNPVNRSVVFIFHGNGGSSDQVIGLDRTNAPHEVWLEIAEREGLVLVVPDGKIGSSGDQGWNDCRFDNQTNPESDDVAFIESLHADIKSRYGSTNSKVYAVGTSNGGHMVQRLADETSGKFDAVAVVVASRPTNSDCAESLLPLSILFMNGTADPLVPYEGGQVASDRGEVLSTSQVIDYWVSRNQTNSVPVERNFENRDQNDDSTIKRFSYLNGVSDSVVEHYEVINGGHTEPSIERRYGNLFKLIVGNQNGDIEMAEEVWKFFQLN